MPGRSALLDWPAVSTSDPEGVSTVDRSFWVGKRVLVTGHTGFKGSWLSLLLHRLGAIVTGYALAPTADPNLFDCARVDDVVASEIGDVRDRDRLGAVVDHAQPEIIFHLAAQSLVPTGYAEPLETFDVNVTGTASLLDALRGSTARVIVVITTDKCYENRELDRGYVEGDALGGADPYSSSKACAELVTAAYRTSFFAAAGVGVATARAGNVLGGGDWSVDRLLPDLLRARAAGVPLVVRYANAVRPWQHVLDSLSGYLILAESLSSAPQAHAEAWNFGPPASDLRTVREVIDAFSRAAGEAVVVESPADAPRHETRTLLLDATKAQTRLGWLPVFDFKTTIEAVVRWHADHDRGTAARVLCERDIDVLLEVKG